MTAATVQNWWAGAGLLTRVAAIGAVFVALGGLWWLYAPPEVERPERAVWCPGNSRQLDARELLGETLQDGVDIALAGGCSVRQVNGDGSIAEDLNTGRINVEIERDTITRIDGVY